MSKLSYSDKIHALYNALRSFNFHEKYVIVGHGSNNFSIAVNNELGGFSHISQCLTYEELNVYIKGYGDAQGGKYEIVN